MPTSRPPTTPRRSAPYHFGPEDPRLPALRAEVADRLRPVRGAMPTDAFERLVREVVAYRLRWAP